ncbi:amino acid permease [Nevskia sp.]|uniref:amino acid permease n=1 Tax=Nevskia sp. TaxID=1929292 RepID=UPI0025E49366|nr:amino acid permease [Nevskia sp.]
MIRNRKIGPVLATALVASNMVGSGLFLLPATLATVGSITVFGWLIATVGALLVASTLARLGQVSPQAGGPCAYADEALGRYMGFQSTTIYWLSCWTGNIAIAVAATGYLASFFTALIDPLTGSLATVALIWLLTLINIYGARLVCKLESVAIVLGLIPIVLVATLGWRYFDGGLFLASWNVQQLPATTVIPESLVLVFWAFTGLESASVAASVIENPQRNVPIATIAGVLLAAVVYIASTTVIMGLIPARELATSSAPFADAIRLMLGPAAGALFAVMVLIKAIGTLGGWILLTAQTGKAGADRGLFPAVFGQVDRHGIAVPNLLIMAVIMTVVVFATASPTLGQQFGKLIEISAIFCLLVYVYAALAVWHYDRQAQPPRGFNRHQVVAALAIVFCLWVIVKSGDGLLIWSGCTLAVTALLYPLIARRAVLASP